MFTSYKEFKENKSFKRVDKIALYGLLKSRFKDLTIIKDSVKPTSKNKITNTFRYPTYENLIGNEEFYTKGIIGPLYETIYNGAKNVLDVKIESVIRIENLSFPKIDEFKIIALEAIQMAFSILTDNNIKNTELFISNDYNSYFYINEKGDIVGSANEYFSQIRTDDFFKYILKDSIYKYSYFDRKNEKIVNLLGKSIIKNGQYINISDTGEIILNAPLLPEYMQFNLDKVVAPEKRMRPGVYRDIIAGFNKLPKPKREKIRKLLTKRSYIINKDVYHDTYGEGKIIDKDKVMITIEFGDNIKKFAIDKVKLYSI